MYRAFSCWIGLTTWLVAARTALSQSTYEQFELNPITEERFDVNLTVFPNYHQSGSFWACAGASVLVFNFYEGDPPDCDLWDSCLEEWHEDVCGNTAEAAAGFCCGGHCGQFCMSYGCGYNAWAHAWANPSGLHHVHLKQECRECECPPAGAAYCASYAFALFEVQPDLVFCGPVPEVAWQASLTGAFPDPVGDGERLSRAVVRFGDQVGVLWYNATYRVASNLSYVGFMDTQENLEFDENNDPNVWTLVQLQATVPAGASVARIACVFASDAATTGSVDFDSAWAERSSSPGTNVLTNSSFEYGPGGWNGIEGWTEFGTVDAATRKACFVTPPPYHGACVAKAHGQSATGVYQQIPVVAGETITAWVQCRTRGSDPLTGSGKAGVRVEWWNSVAAEWRANLLVTGEAGPVTLASDSLRFDDARMDVSGYLFQDSEGRFSETDLEALGTLLNSTDPDHLDRWDFDRSGVIDSNDVQYLGALVASGLDSGVFGDWDGNGTPDCGCASGGQISALYDDHPTIVDDEYRIEFDFDLDGALTEDDRSQFLTAACPSVIWPKGDMNCDCAVDFDDVSPFVLALGDPAAYETQFPDCDILNGDLDDDADVDFDDLDLFVELLSGQ